MFEFELFQTCELLSSCLALSRQSWLFKIYYLTNQTTALLINYQRAGTHSIMSIQNSPDEPRLIKIPSNQFKYNHFNLFMIYLHKWRCKHKLDEPIPISNLPRRNQKVIQPRTEPNRTEPNRINGPDRGRSLQITSADGPIAEFLPQRYILMI